MDTEPSLNRPPGGRWRWILLIFVAGIVLLSQGYRLWTARKVQRELQALRQEGYPTGIAELEELLGTLSDPTNAALKYLEAADYLALGGKEFGEWPVGADPLEPEERDRLKEVLTNNFPALEVIHQAVGYQQSLYPVDYSRGFNAPVPHLAKLKSMALLLKAETVIHSEEARVDLAAASVRDGVALARSLEAEPLLISQLVRRACLAITASALERLLSQHALSREQLSLLLERFRAAREAAQPAYRGGYIGEMCIANYYFRAPAEAFRELHSNDPESAWVSVFAPVYAWSGLRDRDHLYYVREMRKIIQASGRPFPEFLHVAKRDSERVADQLGSSKLRVLSRLLLPALERSAEKRGEDEALLRCVEAALFVELYRGEHQGQVPRELSMAIPADHSTILTDPMTGGALNYQTLDRGFVVYSVGANGTDEGGLPQRRGRAQQAANRAYDIVFRVDR